MTRILRGYTCNRIILLHFIQHRAVRCPQIVHNKGRYLDRSGMHIICFNIFLVSTNGDTNCDVGSDGDAGCQTYFTEGTFGDALNAGSGGYFVVTRSASRGMAVYFWRRYNSNVPPEIQYRSNSLTPNDSWGEPQALFPTDDCDFNSHFQSHNIIMNLSFCVSFLTLPFHFVHQ